MWIPEPAGMFEVDGSGVAHALLPELRSVRADGVGSRLVNDRLSVTVDALLALPTR